MANLHNLKRKVIACATVIEEMIPFLPEDVPYEVLGFWDAFESIRVKKVVTGKDRQASEEAMFCDWLRIVFYGWIGWRASTATLVIPRTEDCIAIFLGFQKSTNYKTKKNRGRIILPRGGSKVVLRHLMKHQKLIEKYG